MPKKETGVDRFLAKHPEYDGRGALIAIFDSGVDPAAAGLQTTSDGKPKILDVIDCTGSGDVDTSKVVKADADGAIVGASGTRLVVNPLWKNPSEQWHVGCKLVYELFTDTLISRLKKERKKKWDEENQEAISGALNQLNEFEKKHSKPDDAKLKMAHEDLQNRLDCLRKLAEGYDDRGPVIDVVVWHDGDVWRVAVDTQGLEGDKKCGKLADFVPLTNYRHERKFGIFSKLDACSFVANVYDDGNLVSIVTDCSPHATHVAGIAAAFHPEQPLLNGVAPGAQLISCRIGDTRLGSMETGTGLVRALIAAVEHKCDLINMSYGEPTLLPDYGRFIDLVNEVVDKHRIIFISSAGNNGPALNTVGAPGGTSSSIIGVGAYVSPAMAAGAHCVVQPPLEGMEYTWSSRGPTADGDLGVSISAPGGAVAPVPTWTLQSRMLMNGTSMSSPSACGGVALLVSAMKAEGIPLSPYTVRKAIENTAASISDVPEEKLTTGHGLLQVDRAFEYVRQAKKLPLVSYRISVNQVGKSIPRLRGIYLRGSNACQQTSEWTVQLDPKFHEDASNLEQLVPFEECLQLHSTDSSVVNIPEYILLTNNGRSFNIVVNPANISSGLHYYEVYGMDCRAPWRGPIFRVPITVIKPIALSGEPPVLTLSKLYFKSGHIERRFINVPIGASWVEVTMRTSDFDTPRRFFLDTVQICPLKRPIKWEAVVTFSSPSLKNFSFPVEGGLTLELSIAQFWSSGIASHEPTCVDFEIVFHGMAKFTAQEVSALQGGGNERAREIFFKEWDSQRGSYPDSSNVDKLRNFIKHVYVERRYTGERSSDRPPRGKDDKDEPSENRRSDGNRGGSRSPPYNESYSDRRSYSGRSDDRNSRYSYGERSPGYDQSDYKKSPRYFEAVDDRSGKTTPVQRFEDRRFSEPRKPETGSPNYEREANGSSPPVVRPVREILGDDAPQLRIGEPPMPNVAKQIDPPKPNGIRTIEPPPQAQRISTATSVGSSEGTLEQIKAASPISLIDFSADPEPSASAPPSQTGPAPQQQPVNAQTPQPINAAAQQPVLQQGKSAPSVSGGDWASFDAFGQQQIPQAGSSVNPLESVLAELSFSETPSAPNASTFPTSVDAKANDRGRSSMIDQSHSSLFGAPLGISGNQNQASTGMSIQGSSVQQSAVAAPMGGFPSQAPSSSQGTSGIQEATSSTDDKSSGRKPLPVDFFTSLYPSAAPTMPGWQRAPQFGMGFAMQYPPGMLQGGYPQAAFSQPAYQQPTYQQPSYQQPVYPQHSYPQPAKASNPFDLGNEPAQAHMPLSGPLGASAGATPETLLGTSSFGVPPQQPQQLYQSSAPQNHYMMQHVPNNMPGQLPNNMLPRQQGGPDSLGIGYDQQAAPRYSQPSTPPSYGAVGGNPFG